MLTRQRLLALAATAAALALAACGGDDSSSVAEDDPASLAPADAPIYVQATLRPKGKLKSDVEALASTISGLSDPAGRLIEEIDKGIGTESAQLRDPDFNFADDIEPWLGERVGFFAEGFSEDPGAAIVQTTDVAAAQQAAEDGSDRSAEQRTYEGVDYFYDSEDDEATGVVEDFLVFGDEPAFKQVVDVSEGGDSLGEKSEFTDALDQAPEGSLLDAYASLEKIAGELRRESGGNPQAVEAALGDTAGKSVIASLVPAADSLEIDIGTDAEVGAQLADLSSLIETFPADSFVALGIPNLGEIVDRSIDQLEDSGIQGLNRESIDQQLSQAGLSIDEVTRALGDLGIFAGGTDEASVQGAAVIASDDPDAAQNLISKLTAVTGLAQLSGDPSIQPAPVGNGISITDPAELGRQPLIVTTEGDRIAIGYGEEATRQALDQGAGATLGSDPTYQQAIKALGGDGVSGYVSMPDVFRLAESLGALADPDYQQAKPYLDTLSYAVFGGGEQGDFQNSKIVVGVQD